MWYTEHYWTIQSGHGYILFPLSFHLRLSQGRPRRGARAFVRFGTRIMQFLVCTYVPQTINVIFTYVRIDTFGALAVLRCSFTRDVNWHFLQPSIGWICFWIVDLRLTDLFMAIGFWFFACCYILADTLTTSKCADKQEHAHNLYVIFNLKYLMSWTLPDR